ncbi:MAG: A24 family peptidase [Bdellovibrionales bacterium]
MFDLDQDFLPMLADLAKGGAISLVAASLATHFGYRSADRLPGESRKPHCVFCMRPLQVYEYFPLFGWLLRPNPLKFPCPCGKRTGLWPQPVVELVGFLLGGVAVALAGWSSVMIPICLMLGILAAISLIDFSFGLIPDELNVLVALLGIAALIVGHGDVFLGLVGAAGLLGLGLLLAIGYSKLRKQEMLGLGDVKFFAAAGLWLPLMMIPWFLVFSGVIGVVLGIVWKHFTGSKEFPFAPALCLTLCGCIYYQLYLYASP